MAVNNGNYALAREYRIKYGMDMPTLKLARIMYKENNLSFTSVEVARGALRAIEGKKGGIERGLMKDKSLFINEERPKNPYKLPESDETSYEPFILNASRVLVLSDIHIPYHSISALTAAFDWGKQRNPDAILLNGDTIDCHAIPSKYVRDPKKRDVAGELKVFKEFFQILQTEFPKSKIYFKTGNHEERYNTFLYQKAHELVGIDEFKLENIIKSRAEGIEVISDKRIIKTGELNIVHGHEFGGSIFSPVNIARGLFLRAKVSALQGHNHQTSEHTETNMNGNIITTFSVGCLSELHPAYLPINKWNHGFAFVEVEASGKFQVTNKRIHKGEVL